MIELPTILSFVAGIGIGLCAGLYLRPMFDAYDKVNDGQSEKK